MSHQGSLAWLGFGDSPLGTTQKMRLGAQNGHLGDGWYHSLAEGDWLLHLVSVETARNIDALTVHDRRLQPSSICLTTMGVLLPRGTAGAIEHQDLTFCHLWQLPGKVVFKKIFFYYS